MNVVDSVTKCTYFIPTHTTINAEGAACLFLKEVWKHHGMPQVVLSDRGPHFITGRHPHMGFEPQQPHSNLESANGFVECMAQGLEKAKVALTKVKDGYAMHHNCQCKPALVFTPGNRVWLDGSDIATNRPLSKLSHQCLGPFVVEACVSHGTYRLALPLPLLPPPPSLPHGQAVPCTS
jgi:hypothetical protein